MATLQDIGTESLLELNVLQDGESPDPSMSATILRCVNNLLDQWKSESLVIYTVTRSLTTIVASQASYTVGTGGQINIPRPDTQQLIRVNFVDTAQNPDLELSMGPLLTDQEYQQIPQKALTSPYPQRAYYNPTYPTGTLIPWPIPTSAGLQWAVYYEAPVPEFTALANSFDLPPGYRRMIVKNLALEMAPSFSRQVDPLLLRQAMDSLGKVKRANQRPVELANDATVAVNNPGWRYWDIRFSP